MQAVVLTGPYLVESAARPEPRPGPEDVLVAVRYVGLCGSDLNAYRGLSPLVTYPRVPGHEVAGIVVDRGPGVPAQVEIGQRVTLSPYSHCGLCPACRQGRTNACQHNQTLGVQRDGALTERMAIDYRLILASAELSLPELALVEPLSVGYHAANRGRVCETDTVLVLGCGTVGTGAILAAARKGATVIAADVDAGKLAQARRFGARHTVHAAREEVLAAIGQVTGGEGVSVAVEAVGRPETYRLAVEAVAYGGRVVCLGYAKQEVALDTAAVVRKELDLLGSRNALRVFPAVLALLERREWPLAELIARVYPFAEAAQAFADWDAAGGGWGKVLVEVGV